MRPSPTLLCPTFTPIDYTRRENPLQVLSLHPRQTTRRRLTIVSSARRTPTHHRNNGTCTNGQTEKERMFGAGCCCVVVYLVPFVVPQWIYIEWANSAHTRNRRVSRGEEPGLPVKSATESSGHMSPCEVTRVQITLFFPFQLTFPSHLHLLKKGFLCATGWDQIGKTSPMWSGFRPAGGTHLPLWVVGCWVA